MPATKSGNDIYITGSGNTLESVASDIDDTNFCEWDSVDTLTIYGNVLRYIRIRNGGELIIGDPLDYSVQENMNFESSVANNLRFIVDAGGSLKQYGNTKIDFMTGSQRSYYTYFYGAVYVRGNTSFKPIWQNYQRIYFLEQQNNDTYSNDIFDIDGLIIGGACTVNYYALYFNAFGKIRNHIFKNITFDKSYGSGNAMYAMRFAQDYIGIRNITFDNINFHNVGNYPLYSSGARVHFKNTTFGTTTSWKLLMYGTGKANSSDLYRDYTYNTEHVAGQNFLYLENCTFQNLNNKACLLASYNATILVKDCTWQHDTSDSIETRYGGKVLMWTGNTFTGGREYYDVNYNGSIQWVFGLTLTINNESGNPIEDAVVVIEQSAGKESFMFYTDSNGKMKNDHNLDVALLTNKHQYGYNKTTDMEYWSDSDNNTYHKVTIFKEGYRPYTTTYVMDQDRSTTIQMLRIDAHASTF